jgi:multidrug efflux system membrane fusion protein
MENGNVRHGNNQGGAGRSASSMRVAIAAFVAGLSIAMTACSSHAAPAAHRATPVRVQAATTGPAMPAITTNGIVATKDEMRLSFKVGGVIKKIYVEEGQTVRKGERLAEIELTEIDAQVAQARALAEKAQRDLDRGERLYADQVVSLEQLQDLRTQAALQQAQLRGIEFNRRFSVIAAPQDGVVLRKLSQERELVPAGQAVVVIGARDRGYVVRAALSDREVVQLKLGDPAEILMDAYPGRAIEGTITEIANAAADKSGMFPVEVRFGSTPVPLASGLVAKLRVHPASSREAALTYVPISAIVEGDHDRASVFVVNGDRVKRRDVRVAFIESAVVALTSGLQPGERVVTDGAPYLEDQEQIEVESP